MLLTLTVGKRSEKMYFSRLYYLQGIKTFGKLSRFLCMELDCSSRLTTKQNDLLVFIEKLGIHKKVRPTFTVCMKVGLKRRFQDTSHQTDSNSRKVSH